jgi:hypothetical protein
MSTNSERVPAEHAQRPPERSARSASSESSLIDQLQRTLGNQAVQRIFGPLSAETSADTPEELGDQIRSAPGGQPMDGNVQRELEGGLGSDLSGVRVHTDSQADTLTRQVNATAFTSGSHIFFRAGAYDPGSPAGRHTLAHEAVHTIQQAAGPVAGTPSDGGVSVSSPDDRFERAAEETAAHLDH